MNLEKRKQLLDSLQKKYRYKKYFIFLLALFTLSVNAFAWFAFTTQTGVEIQGEVASWNIEVLDNETLVHNAVIVVSNMKPGMPNFAKQYEISNNSDVPASLSFEIEEVKILGRTIDLTGIQDKVAYLEDNYPFSIEFEQEMEIIPIKTSSGFTVKVTWPYESETPIFYHLNNIYTYDEYFTYYELDENDEYQEAIINSMNYTTNRDNLYLDKDDADTFFGMECKAYEEESDEPCLDINVRLHAEQATTVPANDEP